MTGPVLHVRFPCCPTERYPALLRLLHGVTPVVQALPPEAAFADVRGARRYFGLDAVQLARLIRVRALALHGADCAIGVAGNPLLARLAAGRLGHEPGVFAVPDTPDGVAEFLADQPVAALPGVGRTTARALAGYGLETAGEVAAAPPATLQRILGASTARRVRELAGGVDPTPVTPSAPARTMTAEHRFDHDELDAGRRRRALLTLADELGYRLRESGQTARALTLTVRYADRTATTRGRALPEPTAHTPALVGVAYALHEVLGLQRARVRAVALRADELGDATGATRQLSLDPRDERRRRAEAAADRARRRFGPRAVGPAGILDVA
ncbi:helix-hairpin-helix domain-containing protein [Streptomyces sp. NPDC127098]|uniref:DNA polymerase Y family protein n=1 Tax=Streptomyces sp. NPDC127098 TaxID=3347137 RepID=UPI00365E6FE9